MIETSPEQVYDDAVAAYGNIDKLTEPREGFDGYEGTVEEQYCRVDGVPLVFGVEDEGVIYVGIISSYGAGDHPRDWGVNADALFSIEEKDRNDSVSKSEFVAEVEEFADEH